MTVSVDAVVYCRVYNATTSVCNVEDSFKSTKLLASTTLRNVLGMRSMGELLSERESIADSMQVKWIEKGSFSLTQTVFKDNFTGTVGWLIL